MATLRKFVYIGLLAIPTMTWAAGCGKEAPKQAPPGAPAETPNPPEIDLGSESSLGTPTDPQGNVIDAPAGTGTPAEAK